MRTPFSQGPWRFVKQLYPTPRPILIFENCLENEVDLEAEGNQNLIQAAPDMYAALQTIVAYAEAHGGVPIILDAAVMALLKANGEVKS